MFSNSTCRTRYLGDGLSSVFPVAFPFFADQDVFVVKRDASGVEFILGRNVDYTITGAGDMSAGGAVTLLGGVVLHGGEVLAIVRFMPMIQTLDLTSNDALPADALEQALDRTMMSAAQANDLYLRGMSLRLTDGLAGGAYDAGQNRISAVADPVLDTDAVNKRYLSILLAQYAQGIATVVTPGGATIAQWNADKLQGRAIAVAAPADRYVLGWNNANNRWEPMAQADGASLLSTINTWTGASNTFSNAVNVNGTATFNSHIAMGGASQRFSGRFYGTPYSTRTLFTPFAGPNHCYIGTVPIGGGGESGWYAFGGPDPDNAPAVFIACGPTNATIQSIATGAGVIQPMTFFGGSNLAMTVRTNGRVGFQAAPDNGAEVNLGTGKLCRNSGAFQAHRNGVVQTIPTGVFTKVNFTTEDFDQAGWFDTALARYQPLIPGKYNLNWTLTFINGFVDQKRVVSILYKNGVYFKTGAQINSSGVAEPISTVGACLVDANGSTDYFEVYAFHDMAATSDIAGNSNDNYFAGFHVG